MSWAESWLLAWRSLVRRFGRAALTVLAVALATCLLTALVTIAATARTKVLGELAKGGPLAGIKVAAAAPGPGEVDSDSPRPGRPRDLGDEALGRIARLPDVVSVVPILVVQQLIVPPAPPAPRSAPEPFFESMVGVDLARAARLPITVLEGRLPAPRSLAEVAVTAGYLERLGLEREDAAAVVGTELVMGAPRAFELLEDPPVRGRWVRVEIVGVVAQDAAPGQVLASIDQARVARDFSASGGTLGGRLELDGSPYSGLFVVARRLDRVGAVRQGIADIGYATSAPENLIASVERYLRVVEIVLSAIGLIALVIAAIGIAGALLADVRERKREIGVLKAIGGRDRDVLRIFLLEATLIGLAGGVVGATAGWAVARAVASVVNGYLASQGLAGVTPGLNVPILVVGVVGSALLALVAGWLPALRAARLPARDAMGAL